MKLGKWKDLRAETMAKRQKRVQPAIEDPMEEPFLGGLEHRLENLRIQALNSQSHAQYLVQMCDQIITDLRRWKVGGK